MNNDAITLAKKLLVDHEGFRLFPYHCSSGKLTIGIGRNLEDRGITQPEALMMLNNDVEYFAKELEKQVPCFKSLNSVRQAVWIDMAFNLGLKNFFEFKNMIAAANRGDYTSSALAMMQSKWAKQVGRRANQLSELFVTGVAREFN